jgi:hypothetical protein
MRSKLPGLIKPASIIMIVLCLVLAPAATACPAQPAAAPLNALRMSATLRAGPTQGAATQATTSNNGGVHNPAIVGMWEVTLFAGGAIFDHAFQQLHADGLEMQNSGIVPPLFDNICWGVWRQIGARTFRLKHFGWNFDADGNNTGTFVLTATIKVSGGGNSYSGNYVADIVLPSGEPDPSQHVTGNIVATRLTLD